jgi:2-iminobutanoate/2-iminopropanoate deaminase
MKMKMISLLFLINKQKLRYGDCINMFRRLSSKVIVRSELAPAPVGPYSQAVIANGMMFISGQLGLNPTNLKFVDDNCVKKQTEQVLKNIDAILKEAGSSANDVIKTTVLLARIEDFAEVNKIYSQYFTENHPARAAYAVKNLPLGALVEIEAIAVVKK